MPLNHAIQGPLQGVLVEPTGKSIDAGQVVGDQLAMAAGEKPEQFLAERQRDRGACRSPRDRLGDRRERIHGGGRARLPRRQARPPLGELSPEP